MTLLTSMLERPLDPGYAAAAERRVAAGLPPSTPVATPTVLLALAVVGLLLTLGALELRTPSTAVDRARSTLIDQITTRRAEADKAEAHLRDVRAEVDQLQAAALGASSAEVQKRLDDLGLRAGAVAVTGPGITLVLDDASDTGRGSADGNPRTSPEQDDGRVQARDVQMVVNGLWQAGAEAIAVNGQRLTSRSAIRFAGEAILVNYRPLTRPYRITAIGDANRLETSFAETPGGAYARALHDNYGIRVSIDPAQKLTLPAATSLTVTEARTPRSTSTGEGTGPGATDSTTNPSSSESP